jgi:hypothetical protein
MTAGRRRTRSSWLAWRSGPPLLNTLTRRFLSMLWVGFLIFPRPREYLIYYRGEDQAFYLAPSRPPPPLKLILVVVFPISVFNLLPDRIEVRTKRICFGSTPPSRKVMLLVGINPLILTQPFSIQLTLAPAVLRTWDIYTRSDFFHTGFRN